MPTPSLDAPRSAASRDARLLGPYETAYDVRRGYEQPDADATATPRAAPEPAWIGRRRDR